MNKYEIIKRIECFAPQDLAEDWDCVGFMVETENVDINKIMLCLTPTNDVIKQAISQNCDMIISHHPMFEVCCNSECFSEFFAPKIDIYSAHTNMDLAKGGTTDTLIKKFISFSDKSKNIKILNRVQNDSNFIRYIEYEKSANINDITNILRKISPHLRYVNNQKITTVKKIGFCAGSGSEFIQQAQINGADCFITGDLKFHTALDSEIVVYDIGHFESEILILPVFKEIIGDGVDIVFAKESSPFNY